MKALKILGIGLILLLVVGLFLGCNNNNITTASNDLFAKEEYENQEEPLKPETTVSDSIENDESATSFTTTQKNTGQTIASSKQLKQISSEQSLFKESTTTKTTTTKKATTTTRKPTTTKPTTTKQTTTKPTTTQVDKILYYYEDGTTGYEPKPGAEYQSRFDGSWDVIPEGKIIYKYEDGSLGYVYKTNSVYYDSLYVDPNEKVLFYYDDGTIGYEPKPGANYKGYGIWQVVSWGNDLTDEEIKEAHKNDSHGPWY